MGVDVKEFAVLHQTGLRTAHNLSYCVYPCDESQKRVKVQSYKTSTMSSPAIGKHLCFREASDVSFLPVCLTLVCTR